MAADMTTVIELTPFLTFDVLLTLIEKGYFFLIIRGKDNKTFPVKQICVSLPWNIQNILHVYDSIYTGL